MWDKTWFNKEDIEIINMIRGNKNIISSYSHGAKKLKCELGKLFTDKSSILIMNDSAIFNLDTCVWAKIVPKKDKNINYNGWYYFETNNKKHLVKYLNNKLFYGIILGTFDVFKCEINIGDENNIFYDIDNVKNYDSFIEAENITLEYVLYQASKGKCLIDYNMGDIKSYIEDKYFKINNHNIFNLDTCEWADVIKPEIKHRSSYPIINGYECEKDGEYITYGCVKTHISKIKELVNLNPNIESIKLDNGDTVLIKDLVKIVNVYNKENNFSFTKTEILLNGIEYYLLYLGLVKLDNTLKTIMKSVPNSRMLNITEIEQIHKMKKLPYLNYLEVSKSDILIKDFIDDSGDNYIRNNPVYWREKLKRSLCGYWSNESVGDGMFNIYYVDERMYDTNPNNTSTQNGNREHSHKICLNNGLLLVPKELYKF